MDMACRDKAVTEAERGDDYRFAGFRLEVGARRLTRRDGTLVKLNARAFDTLALLAAQRGEVLPRRFLLRTLWPDVVVGDNNLNQAVAAIRRALGDDTEPRHIVQTVPGRGYCFVADVQVGKALPLQVAEPSRSERVFSVADYF